MMKKLGFTAYDIERLKKYSVHQVRIEIETREKRGEFTDFILNQYSLEKLRAFIEYRNELIEEYNASWAEIHQAYIEDEKRAFYDMYDYDLDR